MWVAGPPRERKWLHGCSFIRFLNLSRATDLGEIWGPATSPSPGWNPPSSGSCCHWLLPSGRGERLGPLSRCRTKIDTHTNKQTHTLNWKNWGGLCITGVSSTANYKRLLTRLSSTLALNASPLLQTANLKGVGGCQQGSGADTGWHKPEGDSETHRDKSLSLCSLSSKWLRWLVQVHACYVERKNSRVTAGDDKGEAIDGWVQYLSLMSLAAWRGGAQRGKKRRDTERERESCHVVAERTYIHVNKSVFCV